MRNNFFFGLKSLAFERVNILIAAETKLKTSFQQHNF